MLLLNYILVLCMACLVYTETRTVDTGKPWGYLSNCPGVEKPVIIRKKTLSYLKIDIQGPGSPFFAKKTSYNYYQAKKLARDPNLDYRKKTIMYVGGYLDSSNFIIARYLGKLYNDWGYNVLLLDTNRFTTYSYPVASRNIRTVAKYAAEMLSNMTASGLDPGKLEIIGLSLGAQTISFIAKHYRELTGRNVSRLTGLDPSGPCFRHLGPENRLDASDADFVDVIMTNIDGFGMAAPVGHVNFYVNGGEFQPGDVLTVPCNVLCSHIRVYTLWIAAMQYPDKFMAVKCDTVQQARSHECYDRVPLETNIMGLNVDKTKAGIYYLTTMNNFPYYMGRKGLKRENLYWAKWLMNENAGDIVL